MYHCKTCGGKFLTPQKIYETHGFSTPPYEEIFICPICNSSAFKKITHTHCRCCGALLINTEKEYCSKACKQKGEKLWKQQMERFKLEFDSPLNVILREIKAYNSENGTNYSYGQYVALKFLERKGQKCTKKKSNI